jgi:hypothetical protein
MRLLARLAGARSGRRVPRGNLTPPFSTGRAIRRGHSRRGYGDGSFTAGGRGSVFFASAQDFLSPCDPKNDFFCLMRDRHAHHHHHHALAHAVHHHNLVHHAHSFGPGGPWYVRVIEGFSHFSLGWLLGMFGYLLARVWLPVIFLAVGMLAVLVGRVWGRHRLAAAGSWWELRLGEQVSRPALEAFTRTLASGLPRRLFGVAPWVALSVSSQEDRAACGLFVSGGLSPAQVRAAVEQALGGVTVEAESGVLPETGGGVCLRVVSLAPVGSRFSRCVWIIASIRLVSSWLRCARRRPGRAVSFSLCCRPRRGRERTGAQLGRAFALRPWTPAEPSVASTQRARLAPERLA